MLDNAERILDQQEPNVGIDAQPFYDALAARGAMVDNKNPHGPGRMRISGAPTMEKISQNLLEMRLSVF
jgi:hypothetical protein